MFVITVYPLPSKLDADSQSHAGSYWCGEWRGALLDTTMLQCLCISWRNMATVTPCIFYLTHE